MFSNWHSPTSPHLQSRACVASYFATTPKHLLLTNRERGNRHIWTGDDLECPRQTGRRRNRTGGWSKAALVGSERHGKGVVETAGQQIQSTVRMIRVDARERRCVRRGLTSGGMICAMVKGGGAKPKRRVSLDSADYAARFLSRQREQWEYAMSVGWAVYTLDGWGGSKGFGPKRWNREYRAVKALGAESTGMRGGVISFV